MICCCCCCSTFCVVCCCYLPLVVCSCSSTLPLRLVCCYTFTRILRLFYFTFTFCCFVVVYRYLLFSYLLLQFFVVYVVVLYFTFCYILHLPLLPLPCYVALCLLLCCAIRCLYLFTFVVTLPHPLCVLLFCCVCCYLLQPRSLRCTRFAYTVPRFTRLRCVTFTRIYVYTLWLVTFVVVGCYFTYILRLLRWFTLQFDFTFQFTVVGCCLRCCVWLLFCCCWLVVGCYTVALLFYLTLYLRFTFTFVAFYVVAFALPLPFCYSSLLHFDVCVLPQRCWFTFCYTPRLVGCVVYLPCTFSSVAFICYFVPFVTFTFAFTRCVLHVYTLLVVGSFAFAYLFTFATFYVLPAFCQLPFCVVAHPRLHVSRLHCTR